MRTLSLILLLASLGTPGDAAVEVLAALADDDHTRAAVRRRLDAQGVAAIPLLDRLWRQVRTDDGRTLVEQLLDARGKEIRMRVLAGERRWFAMQVEPRLKDVSIDALWRLRLGRKCTLYFDAKTYKDAARLGRLEYLVAPDARKSYETLAEMPPAEWKEFGRAFSAGRPLTLRWVVWGMAEFELRDALPWAKPVWYDHGLKLGENHDERANRRLPGGSTAIQIGVRLR